MALNSDGWVRRFLVTDPQRHRRGFTVYKVTSIVYPVSSPEAVTKMVVWKRYNDFKKLHRELQSRHEKLYLKGSFPPFCKPSVFGRFEEEVVEERRLCALKLLEFAAEHVALFTSQVFVKFFESGYTMTYNRQLKEDHKEAEFLDESDTFEDSLLPESILKPMARMPSVDSSEMLRTETVWTINQSRSEDAVSLGSSFSSDDGGRTSDTESPSTVSSPGKSESSKDLLSFFDPLRQAVASKFSARNENNQQLLSTLQVNDQHVSTSVDDGTCHGAGYIFEAACQVSQAQQHEANGHFEGAFESYKLGIGILLNGVQADSDTVRRQVVREKTAKYLVKAEKIYNSHLLNKEDRAKRIAKAAEKLLCPIIELRSFKVIGVIGKCMLVRDTSLSVDETFVIKTFWKSPCALAKTATIIPQEVPYFVQCLKYFETDSTIFTVLEFISHGKLWDQLGNSNISSNYHVFLTANLSAQQKSSNTQEPQQNPLSPLSPDNSEGLPPMAQDLTELDDENCNTMEATGGAEQRSGRVIKLPWLEMDTSELVHNAQKLLQSVSLTLQKGDKCSSESTARSEKPTAVQYFPKRENSTEKSKESGERSRERLRRSSSRSRSTTAHLPKNGRVIERRYSYDDLLDGRSSLDASGRRSSKPLDISMKQRLPEDCVRVLAAQIIIALEALHSQGIFYGDLNPENILMDENGSVKLTFVGLWPNVDRHVDPKMCDNMYTAPEVSSIQTVTSVSDWWSLGAIIFELLTGKTLLSCHPGGIHSHSILNFPDWVSAEAKSLLTELLKADQLERLGCGSQGVENLKGHPFFKNVDWEALMQHGMRNFSLT